MEGTCSLYLRPTEVRYSQDSIACTFHDGKKIGHTLDQLVNMDVFITDIPPIVVVRKEDTYFARSNRRLWVFKQLALMEKCELIPAMETGDFDDDQYTTDIGGHDIYVRGDHGSDILTAYLKEKREQKLHTIKERRKKARQSLNGDNIEVKSPEIKSPTFNIGFSPRFKQVYYKLNNKRRLREQRKMNKPRMIFAVHDADDFVANDWKYDREGSVMTDDVFSNNTGVTPVNTMANYIAPVKVKGGKQHWPNTIAKYMAPVKVKGGKQQWPKKKKIFMPSKQNYHKVKKNWKTKNTR